MINFRYHVVSLTAVFLALAVGMVLGTAALNGPLTEELLSETQSLRKSNGQLRDQVAAFEDELARRDEFVADVAPLLLHQKLTGKRIVLVALPGADNGDLKAVSENLRLTDATVTGTVRLTDRLVDPANREDARDLATRVLPSGVKEVPSDADGVTASAALLAAVLLNHDPTVPSAQRTAAVSGYREHQFIEVDGRLAGPAEAAILVSGLPSTKPDAAERNAAVVAAIEQFAKAGPVVLAAPAGGDGNPVTVVRDDQTMRGSMSTVDNVNTSLGRLSAVLALVQRVTADRTGHYGIGEGADGRIPKPIG